MRILGTLMTGHNLLQKAGMQHADSSTASLMAAQTTSWGVHGKAARANPLQMSGCVCASSTTEARPELGGSNWSNDRPEV